MNSDYLVGRVIDNRYEIVEIIGSGGMATVYKAKCRVLNRYVAIKVLKDSLKYDTEVVKKFNTESRAAARLSHPNIVQVYDVSENGGLDYIVMEYVDGITLKEYIGKKGRLGYAEACKYAAQIGSALECAHANHVIHRDIKPHNVLMTQSGDMKVADFGIAQAASGETLVAGSGGMGSVHYISPEQARGGYTDERSDIYSLGVVLYEMLTGRVPFDGANPVSIALMKLEQEPTDCRIINPDIPNDVAEIVMKAISKDQHLRYQTAAEMTADLKKVTGSGTEHAGYDSDRFETKRLSVKEAREEFESRRMKRKKKNKGKLAALAALAVCLIGVATYMFMTGGTQEYQVPDLTNMTLDEAREALESNELKLSDDIEFEASDEVEEDHIIRSKPGFNQFVKKGREIKVTVSSGTEDTEKAVPDVENRTQEEAEKMIKEAGLKCKAVEKYSETIQYGYVISQSPKAKTKVADGYTVTIYVSADVEDPDAEVTVPKLTGYSEMDARTMLSQLGLMGNVKVQESTASEGTVIEQSPAAKSSVKKGSTVNLTVSAGHTPTPETDATPAPVMKKKTLTITIPEDSDETVNIRVVANGKEIYNKNHAKSEVTVDIPVQASKDASVQAYINDVKVVDKVISFD